MKKLAVALIALSAFQAHSGDHDTPTRKSPRLNVSDRLRLRAINKLEGNKKGKLSPIKNAPKPLKRLPSDLKLAVERPAIPSILQKLSPKQQKSEKRRSTIAAGASSAEHRSSSSAIKDARTEMYERLRERESSSELATGDSDKSGRKISFLDSKSSARASFSAYNQAAKSARKSSVSDRAGAGSNASASENS